MQYAVHPFHFYFAGKRRIFFHKRLDPGIHRILFCDHLQIYFFVQLLQHFCRYTADIVQIVTTDINISYIFRKLSCHQIDDDCDCDHDHRKPYAVSSVPGRLAAEHFSDFFHVFSLLTPTSFLNGLHGQENKYTCHTQIQDQSAHVEKLVICYIVKYICKIQFLHDVNQNIFK